MALMLAQINITSRVVIGPRGTSRLTRTEAKLIRTLARWPGQPVNPEVLPVHGINRRVHLCNIRKIFSDVGIPPDAIRTIRLEGTKIDASIIVRQ